MLFVCDLGCCEDWVIGFGDPLSARVHGSCIIVSDRIFVTKNGLSLEFPSPLLPTSYFLVGKQNAVKAWNFENNTSSVPEKASHFPFWDVPL
ncbi:hypothetical protein ACS0TY_019945 [Phlomoides rotata]